MAKKEITRDREEKELKKLEAAQQKRVAKETQLPTGVIPMASVVNPINGTDRQKPTDTDKNEANKPTQSADSPKPSNTTAFAGGEPAAELLKKGESDETEINGGKAAASEKEWSNDPNLSFLRFVGGSEVVYKGPEIRMRRKLKALAAAVVILVLISIVSLALFFYNEAHFNSVCVKTFDTAITRVIVLIDASSGEDADFDYDTRAREITAELGVARQMLVFAGAPAARQKCIYDLYYASIRLPNQFKLYLAEMRSGLSNVIDGDEDSGYATLNAVIEKLDHYDLSQPGDSSQTA